MLHVVSQSVVLQKLFSSIGGKIDSVEILYDPIQVKAEWGTWYGWERDGVGANND
jgi:hypothetical protein